MRQSAYRPDFVFHQFSLSSTQITEIENHFQFQSPFCQGTLCFRDFDMGGAAAMREANHSPDRHGAAF